MTIAAPAWTRAIRMPGAVTFALLFTVDSLSRASLATVIPLEALRLLGNARDVSLLFTGIGCAAVGASLLVPVLVRRYRPRRVYTLGAGLLILVPILLYSSTLVGLSLAILLRLFATICLFNVLNLYIMAYIPRRELARSEPLRTFFSAVSWCFGPSFGVFLYHLIAPLAVYLFSASFAVLLLVYFRTLAIDYDETLAAQRTGPLNPLRSIRRFLAQPRLRLAWALNFGRETWWVMFFIYAPVYMVTHGWGEQAGALLISGGTGFLFVSPLFGWAARRVGLRWWILGGFLVVGAGCCLAALSMRSPAQVTAFLLLAAFGAVALDVVLIVPFLRAVRARERPEMTMVFMLYRDSAGLLPPAAFSLLLSFFDLSSVFLGTGVALLACAGLARWIPRGM